MPEIQGFSSFGILLHGEVEVGWQGFVLVMVGVLTLVLLFEQMARRAIRSIHKHRRLSFADRLMRQRLRIVTPFPPTFIEGAQVIALKLDFRGDD